jgi:6-phosphogluconolactonase (cycloisomerase 2 family)
VRVLSLDGDTGTWEQVGQDIAGEAIGDEFGYSASISDDGETIAVGARFNNGKNGEDSGHVRIYRLADDGASWEQIGEDIDGDASDDYSGTSVSLSANGSIAAIGSPVAAIDGVSGAGQVKVYRIDGGGSSWEQLGESIYGDNANDFFGWSVDISPDGNSLAVGTSVSDGPGYAKVFSLENGGNDLGAADWKQVGLTITGEADGDVFGFWVTLSNDAQTLAVGAPFANGFDSGHVGVYRMEDSESVWKQIGEDIDGEADNEKSGWSVSLSANGTTVAIGSYYSGQVRVFTME